MVAPARSLRDLDGRAGTDPYAGDPRGVVRRARRLVVKIGSSSITAPQGGIDAHRLQALVDVVAQRWHQGDQVVLVSSGAIAAGMTPLRLIRRPKDLASQQAAASAGQGGLVAAYTAAFRRHGMTVGQVLLSADDLRRRSRYVNASRTLEKLLELGIVPVVNENDTVATEEIRFGDNDRLAALVAHLVDADGLVLLSDVDALYDRHPRVRGSARVPVVRSAAQIAGVDISTNGSAVGTGGMATKVTAAQMATAEGITVLLTSADQAGRALAGDDVGTVFVPTGAKRRARRRWLAHASSVTGRLVLDPGAVDAVVHRHTSLLPVGVLEVEGQFSAGDTVDLCDPAGRVVARGLVAYDAEELASLVGRRLGSAPADPTGTPGRTRSARTAIRRDDLVVL